MRLYQVVCKLLWITVLAVMTSPAMATNAAKAMSLGEDSLIVFYQQGRVAIEKESNYAKSLKAYLKFIHYAEKKPDKYKPELMSAYSIVAIIYGSFNDFTQCLAYNKKGYGLSIELNDARLQYTCLTNMSQCLIAMKRYDEAEQYNERLLQVKTDDQAHLLFDYNITRGDIAKHNKQWKVAEESWRKAMQIAEEHDFDNYRKSYPLGYLANYYEAQDMPDSQLVCLQKAHRLAMSQPDPYPQLNWTRALMRFYTGQGNTKQAVRYQDMYFGLADSLMNQEEFLKISSDHGLREISEQGEQIQDLNFTVSRQKAVIIVICASLILLAVFAGLVYRQKQNLKRAYKAVFERNKELVQTEQRYMQMQEPRHADIDDKVPDAAPQPSDGSDELPDDKADDLYQRILYVMEHTTEYCDPNFGLPRLASLVESNVVYVPKVIKDKTGMNVRSFINKYRIQEARRRIMDQQHYGQYTILAIAESVGYGTQVNFNRAFKKITGMTPSLYLKMVQEDGKDITPEMAEME